MIRWRLGSAVVAFLVGGTTTARGQDARFTGYFEHQFSTSYANGNWTTLDYDRLRIDVDARGGRGARASASIIYQLFRGDTRVLLRDVLPPELSAIADTFAITIEDQNFLNHVYMAVQPGPFEIVAGKQYLTWGAGFVFNPTELFRPKDVLQPSYDREGVEAIATSVAVGALSDITAALVFQGGFQTSAKVFRARHHVVGFDVSALVAELHEPSTIAGIGQPNAPLSRRRTVGGDITGELFGLGVWAEAAWSDHSGERWVEATFGANYSLADGTLMLLEAFYNGRGESNAPYSSDQWLGRLFGGHPSLGKLLLYGLVSRPFGQLWSVGASAIGNPNDQSAVLIPAITYALAQNVDLIFNGAVYVGSSGTEFGSQRNGGFLRGRIYF